MWGDVNIGLRFLKKMRGFIVIDIKMSGEILREEKIWFGLR